MVLIALCNILHFGDATFSIRLCKFRYLYYAINTFTLALILTQPYPHISRRSGGGSEEIGNREHTPAQHQLSDDCSKRQTKNYICTSSHYLPPVTIFSPYMQLTGACPQSVPIVSTVIERWIVYTVTIQNNIVIHQIYSQNNYSTIQC